MKAWGVSNVGLVRKNNEDSFLVLPHKGLFAVADGMGGHNAGEIASQLAVGILEKRAGDLADRGMAAMVEAMREANERILEEGKRLAAREGMGTTLTALLVQGTKALIGHVGDSRAYLWRDRALICLTEDHSIVAELVRLGRLTESQARAHPSRNVLSRALGVEPDPEVDTLQVAISPGDVFLLITDGVSNFINDSELGAHLAACAAGGEEIACRRLLGELSDQILERGASDNFTIVCCLVDSGEGAV